MHKICKDIQDKRKRGYVPEGCILSCYYSSYWPPVGLFTYRWGLGL